MSMLFCFIICIIVLLICFFSTYSFIPTAVIRVKNYFEKYEVDNRLVYLTFDDGPDEKYTPVLLDLLREHKVHASFFVVTEFAEKNVHIIEQMKRDGHYIALHSKRHQCPLFESPLMTYRSFENSMKTMNKLQCPVEIMRPAWGTFNLELLRMVQKKKIHIVLWNVMAEDWRGDISSEEIERRLLRRIDSGSIVCLHDGRGESNAPSRTIDALSRVIPELKRQGYSFKTVEEKNERKG